MMQQSRNLQFSGQPRLYILIFTISYIKKRLPEAVAIFRISKSVSGADIRTALIRNTHVTGITFLWCVFLPQRTYIWVAARLPTYALTGLHGCWETVGILTPFR